MAHLLFSYVIFVMNTAVFWGSEGTGERSLMIVCGSFFFVAAMGLMLLDDNVLDLGLNSGKTDTKYASMFSNDFTDSLQ
eukprot:m.208988 g.208988  ORF g.208988 m.208988 type:complete len:79 (+) comp39723_c0_seq14:1050-1286(+)